MEHQTIQETFDAVTIIDVLHDMEKRMEITKSNPVKVYFATCDGGSEFDTKSNNFEIGVLATDPIIGSVLLRILRYCFNSQHIFKLDKMYSKDDENLQSGDAYENFILYLCGREPQTSFDINDFSIKPITNIDIWTLPRMITALTPKPQPEQVKEDEEEDEEDEEDEDNAEDDVENEEKTAVEKNDTDGPELISIDVPATQQPITDEVKQQINTTLQVDAHVPEYLLSSKDEANDQPFDNAWIKSSD
jgi:hypothetical protein